MQLPQDLRHEIQTFDASRAVEENRQVIKRLKKDWGHLAKLFWLANQYYAALGKMLRIQKAREQNPKVSVCQNLDIQKNVIAPQDAQKMIKNVPPAELWTFAQFCEAMGVSRPSGYNYTQLYLPETGEALSPEEYRARVKKRNETATARVLEILSDDPEAMPDESWDRETAAAYAKMQRKKAKYDLALKDGIAGVITPTQDILAMISAREKYPGKPYSIEELRFILRQMGEPCRSLAKELLEIRLKHGFEL